MENIHDPYVLICKLKKFGSQPPLVCFVFIHLHMTNFVTWTYWIFPPYLRIEYGLYIFQWIDVCISWFSHHPWIFIPWFYSICWRCPSTYIVTSLIQWMCFWPFLPGPFSWLCLGICIHLSHNLGHILERMILLDKNSLISETESIYSGEWWMCFFLSHELVVLEKIHHVGESRTFQQIHDFHNWMMWLGIQGSSSMTHSNSLKEFSPCDDMLLEKKWSPSIFML